MNEDLLPYYDEELRFMRDMAGEFAEAYPKIAGRLRMSKEAIEDPHVERLIQSFSFLNARIRMKLDDMFPELTDGLLSVLYPQLLEPLASSTVIELTPTPDLAAPVRILRHTQVETEAVDGESCFYTTCYDVGIGPYRLESARIFGPPLPAPKTKASASSAACLRLRLECLAEGKTFTDLSLERVRFHIAAESRLANVLYELVLNNTVQVALADDENDLRPVVLPANCVSAVGFDANETLTMSGGTGSHLHGLLTEYFAFPEKFLFFDITRLDAKTLVGAGRRMDIYLYFDMTPEALERSVGAENFRLFCTPAVNVFRMAAEPIRIDATSTDFRVVANARRESTLEVLRVEKVVLTRGGRDPQVCQPFFSIGREQTAGAWLWQAHRRWSAGRGGGDDVYLSFAREEAEIDLNETAVASIDILCTNRNLPSRLPFGGGQPKLSLTNAVPGIASLKCLVAPTRALRPKRGRESYWRLVSQLALNHLSITGGEAGAKALREMLSIHDHKGSADTRAVIEMMHAVSSKPATTRAPGSGQLAFCSGVDVSLALDDERFSGSGGFLLSSVLDRFLARYCAINSFSRLRVDLWKDRTILRRFPARSGDLTIV